MADDLRQFVREALGAGLPKAEIESKLLAAGWPRDEVASGLFAWEDVDSPVPVPRPQPYLSAAEAFIYLVLFITLYIAAFGEIQLLFGFVHHFFTDYSAPPWRSSADSAIRWSTACLLIAFPVFLWLSRRTYLEFQDSPHKRRSRVRKWLTYMTLVVAAGVLLGDGITLVYYFLAGELTVRFVLKFLVVGAVAGTVFGFYLWHLRQDELDPADLRQRHAGTRALVAGVVAVVAASVVGGFLVAGTPGEAREASLDGQRVQDLELIANGIDGFWKSEGRLPTDLDELSRSRGVLLESISDPSTDEPYDYRVEGERAFELCAGFDREARMEGRRPYRDNSRFWAHDAGEHCFQLEVSNP